MILVVGMLFPPTLIPSKNANELVVGDLQSLSHAFGQQNVRKTPQMQLKQDIHFNGLVRRYDCTTLLQS